MARVRSRIPGLQVPLNVDAHHRGFFEAVKERLELMSGERGDPNARVPTISELTGQIATSVGAISSSRGETLDLSLLGRIPLESTPPGYNLLTQGASTADRRRIQVGDLFDTFTRGSVEEVIEQTWAFQNEDTGFDIQATAPRFRFLAGDDDTDSLDSDSAIWDYVVQDYVHSLRLRNDDDDDGVSVYDITRTALVVDSVNFLSTGLEQNGSQVITEAGRDLTKSFNALALRDISGLSVLGRRPNTTGASEDIVASTPFSVLRRAGSVLDFGSITHGYIADFDESVRDVVGLLFQDNSEIDFQYDDSLDAVDSVDSIGGMTARLVRSITPTMTGVWSFTKAPVVPNDSWSYAKIQNATALSILGRASNTDGDLADITSSADGQVLLRNGSALAFTAPTAPAAGFTISTALVFALTNDLSALEGLASTGFAARTTTDTWAQRSLTEVLNRTTITNPAGIAGNPTIDISATYVGQTSITTLGTITSGTWNATPVGTIYGGTGLITYTLGDLPYSDATNSLARLPGNITTTRKFLRQTGTGTLSAAPLWDTLVTNDVANFAESTRDVVGLMFKDNSEIDFHYDDSLDAVDSVDSIGGETARIVRSISPTMTGIWGFTQTVYMSITPAQAAALGLATSGFTATGFNCVAAGGAGAFATFGRVNGTLSVPTAIANNNILGGASFAGYNGAVGQVVVSGGSFYGQATEAWTATANGADIVFNTVTAGTVTNVARLRTGGNATGGYLQGPDGVLSQPGQTFISDTNSGRYRIGADNMADVVGGVAAVEYGTNYVDCQLRPRRTKVSSPSALASGNNNNYSVAANIAVVRASANAAGSTVTGIANMTAGDELLWFNIGASGDFTFTSEDTNSTAANRLALANATSTVVKPGGCIHLWYDGTSSRARQINRVA